MNNTSETFVLIRAVEPEDLELLYKIENDFNLWDVGVTNVPYSKFMLHEYMSSITGDIYTDKQVRLMIENEQGTVVGIADIVDFNPSHRRAEIGIVIMKEYRHNGYAAATLNYLKKYAAHILHLKQIYAIVPNNNEHSLSLFTNSGFICDATLKNWLFDGQNYRDATLMQYFL